MGAARWGAVSQCVHAAIPHAASNKMESRIEKDNLSSMLRAGTFLSMNDRTMLYSPVVHFGKYFSERSDFSAIVTVCTLRWRVRSTSFPFEL
jgi:hypothetical protein